MDADALRANFETLAEAPGGVGRLRELISQLAVRGKLVPQDPNDEAASELLARIREERESAVVRNKVRKALATATNDAPFEIPSTWCWCRLDDLILEGPTNGYSPRGVEHPTAVRSLVLTATTSGTFDSSHFKYIDEDIPLDSSLWLQPGDLLIQRSNTIEYVGVAAIFDGTKNEFIYPDLMMRIRPVQHVDRNFLHRAMNSPPLRNHLRTNASGTSKSMIKINQTTLRSLPVPLPPLAEQRRIVAKVDELMALCDELEARQERRHTVRRSLETSALETLSSADTPDALAEAWDRVRANWDTLTAHPDSIPPLRQAILQLAVQGKLVPQDPKDEPTDELLQQIQNEKQRLVAEGILRKADAPVPLSDDEWAFTIPPTWRWVRFGAIADHRLGKMLDKGKNQGVLCPYLRNANVRWFDFDLNDLLEMRVKEEELAQVSLSPGDLVICEGGEPGRCAIWTSHRPIVIQKALHRARLFAGVFNQFVAYCLWRDAQSGRLDEFFTGATIKHFTGKALATYSVPLPPIAEQRSIVAKVDEMMTLCDELETRLEAELKTSARFASAFARSVTV